MLKKTLKILWLTVVAVAAFLFASVLAIQTPQVQTFFAKKVIDGLSDKFDGKVNIEKIHFKPFNTLVLKNVSVVDDAPVIEGMDTLFHAEYIIARLSLKGLTEEEGIYIRRAYIADAYMNLAVRNKSVNLTRIFRIPRPEAPKPDPGLHVFTINRVNIHNMSFRMKNASDSLPPYSGTGIDWSDLEVNSINLNARHLSLTGKVMSGILDFMSFEEKSGYVCNAVSGFARVGNGKAEIRRLRLSDPWSELDIPEYTMTYSWGRDFEDFINKVSMYAEISPSTVDMKSLSYFAPGLSGVPLKTVLSGTVSGPVADLNFMNMDIRTETGACLGLDGRITGLPDIAGAHIDADIAGMRFASDDIIAVAGNGRISDAVTEYASGMQFGMDGHFEGKLDDFSADMVFAADSGRISADVTVENLLSRRRPVGIDGHVSSENFDIGRVTGTSMVRECSMETAFSASFAGKKSGGLTAEIDSLKVSRLHFNGYDYSGIAAAGKMKTGEFDGRIICSDPNLNFMLQGIFSLSPKTNNALYKFYANIGYADLNALNIDKRDISKISLRTTANFNRIGAGDILGNIEVGDIILENSLGKHDIGTISVSSHSGDDLYRIIMESEFADASFSGSGSFMKFVRDLNDITFKRELPALFSDTTSVYTDDRYSFAFHSHDSRDLMAFMMPGLYVADSTDFHLNIDGTGLLDAGMKTSRIAYGENYVKNMQFAFDNREHSVSGELIGDTVRVSTVNLENSRLQFYVHDNFVGIGYNYENDGDLINRGELVTTTRLGRDENGKITGRMEFLPSRILLNSAEWSISPSAIDLVDNEIRIDNFRLTNEEQAVSLYGGLSQSRADTLNFQLERFDISVVNSLLDRDMSISGAATGRARIISSSSDRSFTDKGILLGFLCDSTSFAGTSLGTLRLGSEWNDGYRRFDIVARNELGGMRTFDVTGSYTPSQQRLEMNATLDRFDISCVKPFAESVFSELKGHVSGEFGIAGPLDDLKLSSRNARIDDSVLKIAYTNVPYEASGAFSLDDEGVHFDDISIRDRHGKTGSVTGGISLGGFRDIRFNTLITVNEMECIDLGEGDNPTLYGNISGSGNLRLTGRADALKMNIEATTTGNGQLHIPLSGSATASTSDLLTFKEEEKVVYVDPYEEMIRKISRTAKTPSDLTVNARITATPGLEAFIEVDKATGNVLRGRGSGVMDIEIANDNFNIYGDYTLNEGSYNFVVQGLAYRDFTIQDGSSVKFNGDIMQSTLDIDAVYRTKTSLSALIADTSSVATRRTVECGISISDNISNPRLSFSIDIPDIDPTVKSRVESALSTEDKVQKQFLALIVFNNFLPDEQSGVVNNNTSMLYSTVSELMYNQLNSIFQKLDIPLDLGLNYQANERGDDFFDVAVSTQLFNNRVVVNGNIGNRQYNSGTSNSDVVGDLDIEIKLDRTGLFRLNIFSHSSDQYTNYLDNSQRNGVGIAYQQEFNTFKEFFRNLFSGRKKRQAIAAEEAENKAFEKRKRIKIEADDDKRR